MSLTKKQAIQLAESGWWKGKSPEEIALFQLFEPLLCMPFAVFHGAVEQALKRPVWTHEFGMNWKGLQAELLGQRPAPSFAEIVNLIPAEKRIVIGL